MMPVRVTEFVVNEPKLTNHKMQPIEEQMDLLAEQASPGTLRLNFDRVEFLTSMVLAKLVSLHKRMKNAGGLLQIVNVNPEVYEVFQITRLDTILDVCAKPDSDGDRPFSAKSA
jgi:anti-sigma B factor antagonist